MGVESAKTRFPVICLMGPTACGKSRLAIQIAQRLDCEIVSVDSVLVYRGMDIGTAKPSLDERARIPHHLIDMLDQAEVFSTGRFRLAALEAIASIRARGKIPLLVGGTMLYFRGLLEGIARLPEADLQIRREIDSEAARIGWEGMHAQLMVVDPQAAARIHPNDPQRIQRALEVFRITHRPLSELCQVQVTPKLPFDPIKIKIMPFDREQLHRRIEVRFRQMIEFGLVKEVEKMVARGDLNTSLPSVRAVGYRQVWSMLNGEIDYNSMIDRGIVATRQYARRQITWLNKESASFLYDCERHDLVSDILSEVEPFMA